MTRLHPATLLFDTIRVGRAFILPAVVGGASAADDLSEALKWILLLLAVPALLIAVGRYLTYRYRLDEAADELIIDSGILSRRHRVIPLGRIQNIEVQQSPLQRLFGVAELRVETARMSARGRAEAELAVLGHAEAVAMQRELRARRGRIDPAMEPPVPTVLARLSPGDLILAGATANEAGLIAAGLASLLQIMNDLPITIPVPRVDPTELVPDPAAAAAIAIAVGALLVVTIGWLLSIGAKLIRYWGFRLERVGDELRTEYGLLSRHEGTVPLERVQSIRLEESVLRRLLGLASLRIETAGGVQDGDGARGGAEAFVPILRRSRAAELARAIFHDLELDDVRLAPVHPLARRRALFRYAWPIIGASVTLALFLDIAWLGLLALLPGAYLYAGALYRSYGYGARPGYAVARAGVMSRVTWLVPDRKIQTVHARASPFQRRYGLATLLLDTASGGSRTEARIPDLAAATAGRLLRELTQRSVAAAAAAAGTEGFRTPRRLDSGPGIA